MARLLTLQEIIDNLIYKTGESSDWVGGLFNLNGMDLLAHILLEIYNVHLTIFTPFCTLIV